MCKEAQDLQKLRIPLFEESDFYVEREKLDLTRNYLIECELSSMCKCFDAPMHNAVRVWIPRQDQIQDLLKQKRSIGNLFLTAAFCDTLLDKQDFCSLKSYWREFTSLEELWLAFYYYDIGKIWDSKTLVWQTKTI